MIRLMNFISSQGSRFEESSNVVDKQSFSTGKKRKNLPKFATFTSSGTKGKKVELF